LKMISKVLLKVEEVIQNNYSLWMLPKVLSNVQEASKKNNYGVAYRLTEYRFKHTCSKWCLCLSRQASKECNT
jgi:hypothetical protein